MLLKLRFTILAILFINVLGQLENCMLDIQIQKFEHVCNQGHLYEYLHTIEGDQVLKTICTAIYMYEFLL